MTFTPRLKAGLLASALLAASPLALAQTAAPANAPPPGPAPALIVHTLKAGKLYWIEGGGGNSGVIIGDKGVIVIDAKTTADAGRALLAEVAKLTPKPVDYLIETHSDGDHVNGAAAFASNVKIIAHINNLDDQLVVPIQAKVELDGGKCIPPADRLPSMIIYNDKVSATLDGVPLVFYHFAPAHTSGDLMVSVPADKVVFTGDILTSNVLVHPEKAGSLDGWFTTARGLMALDADAYVPGHASTTETKAGIAKRIEANQASRDKVDALVDQGRSLAEVKTAMGDPPKDSIGCRGVAYPSLSWIEYQDHLARREELK